MSNSFSLSAVVGSLWPWGRSDREVQEDETQSLLEAASTQLKPQDSSECCGLSWSQRILGFATFFCVGCFISLWVGSMPHLCF